MTFFVALNVWARVTFWFVVTVLAVLLLNLLGTRTTFGYWFAVLKLTSLRLVVFR